MRKLLVVFAVVFAVSRVPPPASALPPTPPSATVRDARRGSLGGFSRERFGGDWQSVRDGCDVRDRVLKRDGRRVRFRGDCTIRSGRWRSVYDGVITTRSALVDVDHIVALAHAWQTGARRWTPSRRERFANDRRELIAVSETANSAKSDSRPEQWKRPGRAVWCLYARWWIDIKTRYRLTTTRRARRALGAMLQTCPPASWNASR